MRRMLFFLLLVPAMALAGHRILTPNYKSLEVMVNNNWMALPIMQLGTGDVLNIGFDELSHTYRRLTYHLEPCNPDWTSCEGLFESDWLEGFNDRPIEDYENSINTNVLYTHYRLQLPNDDTRLKMSGNYRLHIMDEEESEEVICIEFRVLEPLMRMTLGVTTNTDLDLNGRYQQASLRIDYGPLRVTNAAEQVQVFVMQNGREDNMKENVRANYVTASGMAWEHNKGLIFDAGNEYRKFEALDPSHTTMGLAHTYWDEESKRFHAYPFFAEPRRSYIYDEDANGAFLLRNSDNVEAATTSEYLVIHYKLKAFREYKDATVRLDGRWAVESPESYVMTFDEHDQTYNATVLQKLGYYNYQVLLVDFDGTTHPMPEEGSFYQTENDYQAMVYYRGIGERSWRLAGFCETKFRKD